MKRLKSDTIKLMKVLRKTADPQFRIYPPADTVKVLVELI